MNAEFATLLTTTYGLEIIFDARLGLTFTTERPAELKGALSNVMEALRTYEHITSLSRGGQRFKLLSREDGADRWIELTPDYNNANDAVIEACTLSKNAANGIIQVYDALGNREIMLFPAGGLS